MTRGWAGDDVWEGVEGDWRQYMGGRWGLGKEGGNREMVK